MTGWGGVGLVERIFSNGRIDYPANVA